MSAERPRAALPIGGSPRQMLLDLGFEHQPALEDFLPGANSAVLSHLSAWHAQAVPQSPVYLWGPSGCGKTHLLRAMLMRALQWGWGGIWLAPGSCQMWAPQVASAPTLALMDDAQDLHADEQHLAFNLFIESVQATRTDGDDLDSGPLRILAAGKAPPVDLPVRDDLRTRLGWGLVFQLQALDDTGLQLVLQHEARRRGMHLPDEVLTYLLARVSRDLGSLMRLLDQLDHVALEHHRQITVPLVRQVMTLETS